MNSLNFGPGKKIGILDRKILASFKYGLKIHVVRLLKLGSNKNLAELFFEAKF